MTSAILSILFGVILSIIWGFGSWLKWQGMKNLTIIPSGRLTTKYGEKINFYAKGICFFLLLFTPIRIGWWILLSFAIMWFVGGWIATLIERILYCNEHNMKTFIFAAEQYTKEKGFKYATIILKQNVPKWWIKLMPLSWQVKLSNGIKTAIFGIKPRINKQHEKHFGKTETPSFDFIDEFWDVFYRKLIEFHVRKHSTKFLSDACMGETMLLPKRFQEKMADYIDEVNKKICTTYYWETTDCTQAFFDILEIAIELFEINNIMDTSNDTFRPENQKLAFSLFWIPTLNIASSASQDRKQRKFMGIRKGVRVFR